MLGEGQLSAKNHDKEREEARERVKGRHGHGTVAGATAVWFTHSLLLEGR